MALAHFWTVARLSFSVFRLAAASSLLCILTSIATPSSLRPAPVNITAWRWSIRVNQLLVNFTPTVHFAYYIFIYQANRFQCKLVLSYARRNLFCVFDEDLDSTAGPCGWILWSKMESGGAQPWTKRFSCPYYYNKDVIGTSVSRATEMLYFFLNVARKLS